MILFNLGRACIAAFGLASMAQDAMDWPPRPIGVAVLNALGGASDMFARALAVVAKDVISRPRRSA
ncbi:hypothetical protein KM031_19145 (plasmid) [Gemmobacter fulvus]|uniref:MFS transporter n=1 Tax=Gemmobacter fulvus TaxID=2840474 RepID=A0A975PCB0_9RHOB|nr:hypothetical protein [Gemmobacter fulvus]MBT9246392.1 hypothetical protein [Gemmobacter fulvus]QWK92761.1 hypothetical protein KM031_19145 [Gemmobacter fulvus]